MDALLQMSGICKTYPGVVALEDVSFDLRPGEVHCLLGENGAGKSTLMKVLAGAIGRDAGTISLGGAPAVIETPADAQRHGIGMIYQDFKLVPELSVAENIFLGNEPRRGRLPFIDFERMHERSREVLAMLGESIPTTAQIRALSIAQRQVVEIAKALSKKVRVLAMDEPTAPLTDHEMKNLFKVIRLLKAEGVGIIYISHRLEEIFEIGDRITVLRDGQFIHTCAVAEADKRSLVRWMVGRELEQEYPKTALERGDEILTIEHLHAGMLRDINLSVYRGEVLGLAGLVGAGRSELARVLFGADPRDSGRVFFRGKEFHPRSPREAIDEGIGLLTEDRNAYGLIMQMSVRENITLASLRQVASGPFIAAAREAAVAERYSAELRIKTPSIEQQVEHLSGGNRQKVVLARWLFTNSALLIFDEPTAGIDVGVKYEIYQLINRLAQEGVGVIVISSDLPELLGVSDRVAVMCEGRITGVLRREEATQERVMLLATGETTLEASHG